MAAVVGSDQFDDDSLDLSLADNFDNSQSDLDEVPQSPLLANHSTKSTKKQEANKIFASSTNHTTDSTVTSKSLPIVVLHKDEQSHTVVDYRTLVNKKLTNSGYSFGTMRLKDFKKAQKAMKQGEETESSLGSSLASVKDGKATQAKKAKVISLSADQCTSSQLACDNEDKNFVSNNMRKLKETVNMLHKCVDRMQPKQNPNRRFLKTRKSIFPAQSDIIVSESDHSQPEDEDSLNEIPDSLENSENEVAESDLEDNLPEDVGRPIATNHQFIQSRPSMAPKNAPIFADDTIEETNADSSNSLSAESVCFNVNETIFPPTLKEDSSVDSVDLPPELLADSQTNPTNSDSSDDGGKLKLKFFKKKKNTDFAHNFNHNVAQKSTQQSQNDDRKMLHSPVRKRTDRKQLLGFICKQCQDYYSGRNLTDEQMQKLIQECSRHRAKHSPYRSPKKFWETDFSDSPQLAKAAQDKRVTSRKQDTAKIKNRASSSKQTASKRHLELYHEWEEDFDSNSPESNALHSTKLM